MPVNRAEVFQERRLVQVLKPAAVPAVTDELLGLAPAKLHALRAIGGMIDLSALPCEFGDIVGVAARHRLREPRAFP